MDLKIVNKTDDEVFLEFQGESHTLLNLLRTELLVDERTLIATYDKSFQ
jgi:DNA-directed RNA polymerase subunit L